MDANQIAHARFYMKWRLVPRVTKRCRFCGIETGAGKEAHLRCTKLQQKKLRNQRGINMANGKHLVAQPASSQAVATIDDNSSLLAVIARAASDPNTDLDKMERLLQMQERVMAKRAEMQFIEAMTAFKANPPTILKNKHVSFGQTAYDHATLDNVCREIIGGLSAHGISHRWVPSQDKGVIKVTCILTHIGGHSESCALESGTDTSGSKNPIQAIGSATTYLQRYTLLMATGLATGGQDDDGSTGQATETISEKQAADLLALITEKGADKTRFLTYCKVARIEDIMAVNYSAVVTALQNKKVAP